MGDDATWNDLEGDIGDGDREGLPESWSSYKSWYRAKSRSSGGKSGS